MSGLTFHHRQLTAHIVFDAPKFFTVVAPSHHVTMAANGSQTHAVRFIQISFNPFFIYLILTAITRKRVHILSLLLKPFQIFGMVVNKDILIVQMVTTQQHPDRRGKRQAAIASVR
jgi:hypothetical protein